MQPSIKNKVFNDFSKTQKSELCAYLAKYTKKFYGSDVDEILEEFLEEEEYYLELGSSRHPWLEDCLDEEEFVKDVKLYIKDQIKKCDYKEKQKPYIEKQKVQQKKQRKNAQEFKMSKEPPTKAQLKYYNALCKKYKQQAMDIETASKLDLRDAIDSLLNMNADKQQNLDKIDEIKKNK